MKPQNRSRNAARQRGRRAKNVQGSPAKSASVDGGVLLATAILASMGIVMSFSATAPLALEATLPPLFIHHLEGLALGVVLAALCMSLSLRFWRAAAFPFWVLGVGLLVATLLFGVEVNGARRWLAVPGTGFRFQPVEAVKLCTVLAVALIAARPDGRAGIGDRRTLAALAVAAPPILLLLAQPDLGNAILLAGIVALVLFVAGASIRVLLPIAAVGIAGVLFFIARNPYAWRRVAGFLDPWKDAQDSGFQLVQSFVAFGHGGLYGVGLGNGWQKLHYLPEVHTDFVLALIAEELGLLGVLFVLGAFAALVVAGTRVARQAQNRFALLLAFGLTALLTLPALVNAGVVMGVLPTKGLTLPFLSYGRTSLVVCLAATGILLGIARNELAPRSAAAPPITGRLPWQ